jgi:hypothetical protein
MAEGGQRNLRVVQFINPDSGEIVGQHAEDHLAAELEALKAQLADANRTIIGLERDLKAAHIRHRKAVEDKAAEARESYLWPVIAMMYAGYQKRCRKTAVFTSDRFWAAEPFFRTTLYGKTLEDRVRKIATAIAGAQHDPYKRRRKNGTYNTFDGWSTNLFVSTDRFDEFVAKAPVGFEPVLSPRLTEAIRVAEGRARQQTQRKASERATG